MLLLPPSALGLHVSSHTLAQARQTWFSPAFPEDIPSQFGASGFRKLLQNCCHVTDDVITASCVEASAPQRSVQMANTRPWCQAPTHTRATVFMPTHSPPFTVKTPRFPETRGQQTWDTAPVTNTPHYRWGVGAHLSGCARERRVPPLVSTSLSRVCDHCVEGQAADAHPHTPHGGWGVWDPVLHLTVLSASHRPHRGSHL